MAILLKWKRGEDGFTETHCGIWEIVPIFSGKVRPIGYTLNRKYKNGYLIKRLPVQRFCTTQRQAKALAQQLANR